jgi:hypothetical protein
MASIPEIMSNPWTGSTVLLVAVAMVCVLGRHLLSAHQLPLPPGPKGLPLLGNINDLPGPGVVESYHWAKHKNL